MSLAIDPGTVEEVMIGNMWHAVSNNTFDLDSYEFVEPETQTEQGVRDGLILHGGGQSGICATGFSFRTHGSTRYISGPLSAIQAVKHRGD